jgi:peptidoglycan hydrolase-like protein with peptidoglycan-binding domain
MPGAGGGRLTSIAQRHRRGLLVIGVGLSVVVPGVTAHATTTPTPPSPPTVPTGEDPTTTSAAETTSPSTEPTVETTLDPTARASESMAATAAAPDTTPGEEGVPAADADAVAEAPPPPTTAPLPMPTACVISSPVRYDDRGANALCVEWRLVSLGYHLNGPDDWFSISSVHAVRAFQRDNRLTEDGIVGRTTGRRLGIWVDGAVSAGPSSSAAPVNAGLPANSGTGRRVVYDRGQQRVWAVEEDGTVVKTHAVSGRIHEPYAGTYSVYSRSLHTYSTDDPDVKWRYMVRFAYGPNGGRIGFHEIPTKFGVPLQSESQLGQPLSGGCVRQSTPDAQWMWDWAQVGTKVVVL